MRAEIDFTIIVLSITGIWFVWDLGIKKLLLDLFRERLFELRFALFQIGAANEISFDDDAYRSIELLLCGLLRYGHRLTFLSFLLSIVELEQAEKSKDYVDYSKQIQLKVSKATPQTREKLNHLLHETHKTVSRYVSFSSLFFMLGALLLSVLRAFNFCRAFTRREVSTVFESEAYRAESSRNQFGNMAAV